MNSNMKLKKVHRDSLFRVAINTFKDEGLHRAETSAANDLIGEVLAYADSIPDTDLLCLRKYNMLSEITSIVSKPIVIIPADSKEFALPNGTTVTRRSQTRNVHAMWPQGATIYCEKSPAVVASMPLPALINRETSPLYADEVCGRVCLALPRVVYIPHYKFNPSEIYFGSYPNTWYDGAPLPDQLNPAYRALTHYFLRREERVAGDITIWVSVARLLISAKTFADVTDVWKGAPNLFLETPDASINSSLVPLSAEDVARVRAACSAPTVE